MGTLCAHFLLQFYVDSFETSQVFLVMFLDSSYLVIVTPIKFTFSEIPHYSKKFLAGDISSPNLLVFLKLKQVS